MISDTTSIRIAQPAEEVFTFVANPKNLDRWSFGTWQIHIDETGLVRGTSIKDGSQTYVRIAPHPDELLIDYFVGAEADALQPRIFIRIARGDVFGAPNDACLLMMTALRTTGMDSARWEALKATHAVEVDLIRAAVETGYDHRTAKKGQI